MTDTYLRLRDFDPGVGQEYSATLYPAPGLYYNQRLGALMLVLNGVVQQYYCQRPKGDDIGLLTAEAVARLLAVALHPEAAMKAVS